MGGLVFLSTASPPSAAGDTLRTKLIELAAQAKKTGELTPLRQFAQSGIDPETRGQAYLAVGYREYATQNFTAAGEDLRRSCQAAFSLADIACYYWALAAREAGKSEEVIEALGSFKNRFPASPLRVKAAALLGEALLETAQAEQAIQVLAGEPRVRLEPELALLLGQAYRDAGKPAEAARTFQEIYYAFPATAESRAAAEDLERLRKELGESFPQASEEIRSARAETLLNKSLPAESLADYEKLLQERPASPFKPRWQLGRARCLIRLRRREEAIALLEPAFAGNPELDAQRLNTLVEAFLSKDDAPAALIILNQLRAVYPASSSYAAALARVGNYFVRTGEWKTAADYYRTLLTDFPQSPSAREASWRSAWNAFLQGERDAAARAMADHIARYPDSPHIPAALYWLGRIAEEAGAEADSRQFYRSVRERFVHSYYALQAVERLKDLDSKSLSDRQQTKPLPPFPLSSASLNVGRRDVLPVQPCTLLAPNQALRPFLALTDLGLAEIGEEYLIAQLSDQPDAPGLLLALSLSRAAQGETSAALLNAKGAVPKATEYDFSALPEEFWKLLFPRDYWKLVQRQARANGLDPYIVMGLIRQESAFNPRAVSTANARGLMQILPSTASPNRRGRRRAAQRLFDPAYNLRFGCRHFRALLKIFNGNLEQALAAYNAGDSRVRKWKSQREFRDGVEFMETIPIPATRGYVEAVLRDSAIYRQLLSGTAKFAKCL